MFGLVVGLFFFVLEGMWFWAFAFVVVLFLFFFLSLSILKSSFFKKSRFFSSEMKTNLTQ